MLVPVEAADGKVRVLGRVFPDGDGRMNLSLRDIGGAAGEMG